MAKHKPKHRADTHGLYPFRYPLGIYKRKFQNRWYGFWKPALRQKLKAWKSQ